MIFLMRDDLQKKEMNCRLSRPPTESQSMMSQVDPNEQDKKSHKVHSSKIICLIIEIEKEKGFPKQRISRTR